MNSSRIVTPYLHREMRKTHGIINWHTKSTVIISMTAIFRFYFLSTTLSTASCNLSDNIYDYYNVSQGKITIPSMDDGEEFTLTDVSFWDRFALV